MSFDNMALGGGGMGLHGAEAGSVQVSTSRSHSVIRKSNLMSSRSSEASQWKESGRAAGRGDGTQTKEEEEEALEFDFIRKGGLGPDAHPLPPFLYGTHYSTPGYVLFLLVRR